MEKRQVGIPIVYWNAEYGCGLSGVQAGVAVGTQGLKRAGNEGFPKAVATSDLEALSKKTKYMYQDRS